MSVVMRFGTRRQVGDEKQTGQRVQALHYRVREADRRCIAEEVERLVDMLDVLDGDPDLEDEPDAEDGHDAEMSLGWTSPMAERMDVDIAARGFCAGVTDDDRELDEAEGRLEDAGDEREEDHDAEASLGWTTTMAWGSTDDGEISIVTASDER